MSKPDFRAHFIDRKELTVLVELELSGRMRFMVQGRNPSCKLEHFVRAMFNICNGMIEYDKCAAVEIHGSKDGLSIFLWERGNKDNCVRLSATQAMSIQAWARAVFTLKKPKYLKARKIPAVENKQAYRLLRSARQGFPSSEDK